MKFFTTFCFIAFFAFFELANSGAPSLSEYCQQVCLLCNEIPPDQQCDCISVDPNCIGPPTYDDSSLEYSIEESSSEEASSYESDGIDMPSTEESSSEESSSNEESSSSEESSSEESSLNEESSSSEESSSVEEN